MKLTSLRRFLASPSDTLQTVAQYLSGALTSNFREIETALQKISFADNFEGFEIKVTILAASESVIRNRFTDGTIPTRWLILDRNEGGLSVYRSNTPWTKDYLYLSNANLTLDAQVTVFFMR